MAELVCRWRDACAGEECSDGTEYGTAGRMQWFGQ